MRLLLSLLFAGLVAVSTAWSAPIVDGTRDASYGSAVAVQTTQTQFGDNLSELDAAYAQFEGGVLYLLLTGQVEANFNRLNIFIDSQIGGQNQIGPATDEGGTNPNNDDWAEKYSGVGPSASGTGPGFTFDAAFSADYLIIARNGAPSGFSLDYAVIAGGASAFETASDIFGGTLTGSNASALPANGIGAGYDNSNVAGIVGGIGAANQAAALAVMTGLELAIPLAAVGHPGLGDTILISAHLINTNHDFLSNQSLAGFVPPQGNLGSDGTGAFTGDVSAINLNAFGGLQYFSITVAPEASPLALVGLGLSALAAVSLRSSARRSRES